MVFFDISAVNVSNQEDFYTPRMKAFRVDDHMWAKHTQIP